MLLVLALGLMACPKAPLPPPEDDAGDTDVPAVDFPDGGGAIDAGRDAATDVPPRRDTGPVEGDAITPPGDGGGGGCSGTLRPCGKGCYDLSNDPNNCGACGVVCERAGAVAGCSGGVCITARCREGFGDCDGNPANGCETATSGDANNCGVCGMRCSFANAAATCASGRCALGACTAGYMNCNNNPADGCEVNTSSGDPTNCGRCGNRCLAPPLGATAVCSMGQCGLSTLMCPADRRDCNGAPLDGCETAVMTDVANCGACGMRCASTGGTPSCAGGQCGIACGAGLGNCDGMLANGCETSTLTSALHCGGCGRSCSLPNATAGCAAGACTVVACSAGFGNCDNNPANGCEVNTAADNRHCGACGNACPGGQTCISGVCRVTCAAGQSVCAGACVNPATDNRNCGGCGVACGGGASCVAGVCQCPTGQTPCAGQCRALQTDNANCGACGRACGGGQICSAGTCTTTCAPGTTVCAGVCRDLANDSSNCMACGRVCAYPNGVGGCRAGQCYLAACAQGFADCDTGFSNGCEVNTGTDAANCGVCGNRCQFANAAATCVAGRCAMGACLGTFRDCNRNPADGCEVNTAAGDINNCGACGTRCPPPPIGTSAVCRAGMCGLSSVNCPSDRRDCNGTAGDGCEVAVLTDVNNCGACGTVCSTTGGTPSCAGGVCGITCSAGLGNCDGMTANGCETSTATSPTHCGGCNRVCSIPNATAACSAGMCTLGSCNAGFGDCDAMPANGCERNLNSDNAHCGACGVACGAGRVCSGGVCQVSCGSLAVCSGQCRDTSLDPDNCGACGAVCSATGMATRTCGGGVCNGVCAAGRADCDTNLQTNGCETDISATPTACGGCGRQCSTNHVTPTCAGGMCTGACMAGYADCNADLRTDGCETATAADVANCGGCGVVCPTRANATVTCAAGACGFTCNGTYRDCDMMPANGCETDVTTVTDCGACGVACMAGQTCAMTAGVWGCV